MGKRILVFILAGIISAGMITVPSRVVRADAGEVTVTEEDKPYLSLGKDLTSEQLEIVLSLMGLETVDLSNYDVTYVTNDDEYTYLGDYLDASVIGSKALSSVLIMQGESGQGLNITTKNITYCTVGMYKNALITAGVEDADIIVAAPYELSGTAALVGATKAYEDMTGESISNESIDAATNELVVTGELASSIGDSGTAEELLAYLKQKVAEAGSLSDEEISDIIDQGCTEFGVTLTDDEKSQLISLMSKIDGLNLDADALKNQAKEVYDKLKDMGFDIDSVDKSYFQDIWAKIKEFIDSLF